MSRRKRVYVWLVRRKKAILRSSSITVGSVLVGFMLWFFRSVALSFAESVVTWNFPWNIIVLGISLVGFFMRKPIKNWFGTLSLTTFVPKKWTWIGVLVTVIILLAVSFAITNAIVEVGDENQTKVEQKTDTGKDLVQPSQNIPTSRKVLGVLIILIVIGIFIYGAIAQWEDGKKLYQQKFWRGPVGVTAYVILGIYLVVAFLLPNLWSLMWGDQMFFWSLTIGILILVSLRTMTGSNGKPLTYADKGSWIFGTLLVLGLYAQMSRNPYWHDAGDIDRLVMKRGASSSTFTNIPVDVAKRVVCECESNCQQFESDGKTPLKNKGIPGTVPPSSAFGKYQFLEVHREPALKLGFDLNTEDGQERYFEYLYGKEGFGPWDHDNQHGGGSACWGPKLAALGYDGGPQPVEILTVKAPVEGPSAPVNVTGHYYTFSQMSPAIKKFRFFYKVSGIENHKDFMNNETDFVVPGKASSISFQSLESEPLSMRVTRRPKT